MRFASLLCLLALGCAAPRVDSATEALAPAWLLQVDGSGTWQETDQPDVVRAWIDARVANLSYHKRVLVETAAPYPGGVVMRTLLPASHRQALGNNKEIWGTSAIEIYPTGGPYGASLSGPVMARLRMQHDGIVVTPWVPLYGEGAPWQPDDSAWAQLDSPASAVGNASDPKLYFAPFDDPGAATLARMDAVIHAQHSNPGERHTIHAAVYNITDDAIVGKLIEAHQAGVEVRLLFDGRKFRPWYAWYTGDDRLLAAGVPMIGVKREGSGAMHNKIALFDGQAVATGSFNWESGSRFNNNENMLVSERSDLVAAYARRFEALAGGVLKARVHAADVDAAVSVSFAPDEEPHRIVGRLIDQAQTSIYVAMFTAKDIEYWEQGQKTSLLRKLVSAHERGVDVRIIVDYGIHEASEFHGVESEDDPIDEWLEDQGVHVVRADNPYGQYSSMHHKFVVIDDEVAVTGAFNWYYDAAFSNDEDQLVWRDADLAARFRGEFVDMCRHYDPDYEPSEWPQTRIQIEALVDWTHWGDGVTLVGNHESLGQWSPAAGLHLDATTWPVWRGEFTLPAGLHVEHKLVVERVGGGIQWPGDTNQRFTVPTGPQFTLRFGID